MLLEILLGLVVGIIMSLTGAGGGILAVPLLVFGVQLEISQAGPIGLLAVGVSAAIGAALGLKKGIVRYKAALLMASAGIVLAPLGVWLANRVENRWLSILFSLVLMFVAVKTFQQAGNDNDQQSKDLNRRPPCIVGAETGKFIWTGPCARSLALSGAIAGLLSGLLGVGGGFVMIPALKRYTDLEMQSMIATSLAVIALVSISAITSSALAVGMNWDIALPFSLGAIVGMLSGRILSSRIAASILQKGFAVLTAIVAIGMIIRSIIQ